MKKIIYTILVVILALFLVAAGSNLLKKRKAAIVNEPVAIPLTHAVKIVMPATKSISGTVSFLARLEAGNTVEITSKLTGRITKLLVSESQKVKRGELLVGIDDQELLTAIASLLAQLVSAEEQYEFSSLENKRNLALFQVGGVAKEKLDASKVSLGSALAKVKDLQQRVAGLRNQLSYLRIKAPFDGIVGTVFLHRGDLAAPVRPIISLNSLSQKLVFSFMPGSTEIMIGQSVLLDGLQIGSITTIYNDAQDGLTVAEVELKKKLPSPNGSYLTIEVRRESATGCAVPAQALLHRRGGQAVMVYDDNHFTEKEVTVVASNKDYSLIDPCIVQPVALASEAKLALLPTYGSVAVRLRSYAIVKSGEKDE